MTASPLYYLKKFVKWPIEAIVGRIAERFKHCRRLRCRHSLQDKVSYVTSHWTPPAPSRSPPIFLLAAGWRSGSTLVQRLIMSSGEALLWGEPYHRLSPVQRLCESLPGRQEDQELKSKILAEEDNDIDIKSDFIANVYPSQGSLVSAHRAYLQSLLESPARNRGYRRWGFKEVRFRPPHWRYLKFLFPNARIIFLVRHPYHAYRSYKVFPSWYERWPEKAIFTPSEFGELWSSIALGMWEDRDEASVYLLKFEDLIQSKVHNGVVDLISNHVGMDLDQTILTHKVHGRGRTEPEALEPVERYLLQRQVGPVAHKYGYEL